MEEEKRLTTDELLKLLFKERSLEQFLQRNESAYLNTTFADYLSGWCRREHEVPEQLIRRANLEKSFGHQLFTGKRNPSGHGDQAGLRHAGGCGPDAGDAEDRAQERSLSAHQAGHGDHLLPAQPYLPRGH